MQESEKNSSGKKTLFAALVGAITGAAAVILSKKENREKVAEKLEEGKKLAEKAKQEVEKQAKELTKTVEKHKKQVSRKATNAVVNRRSSRARTETSTRGKSGSRNFNSEIPVREPQQKAAKKTKK